MADYKTLLFGISSGVARITLNRPEAHNAVNPEMCADLIEVVTVCEREKAVRAVLIDAVGPAFSGGGDLKFLTGLGDGLPAGLREMAHAFHTATGRLHRLEKPVVCAVHGACAGGGLMWPLAADLVLAAESARFKVAYSAIGLTMDGGSTFLLPRLVGMRRAVELAMTNRAVPAKEALEIGLITEVVPELELSDRAAELAAQLAAGPTWALGRIKTLLREGWNTTMETQLEAETRSVSEASGRADGREGLAAFVEKRAPSFSGA